MMSNGLLFKLVQGVDEPLTSITDVNYPNFEG